MNVHQQLLMSYSGAAVASGLIWNPSDKGSSCTLENSNLDVFNRSSSAIAQVARAISPKTTGKYYAEFEVFNQGSTKGATVGIGVESTALSVVHFAGGTPGSVGYWNDGSRYKNGSTFSANSSYAFAPGDVVGIAFDADTGGMWFRKNGTWVGTDPTGAADSSLSTGATYALCCTPEDRGWGARIRNTLSYSLPSGFVKWE